MRGLTDISGRYWIEFKADIGVDSDAEGFEGDFHKSEKLITLPLEDIYLGSELMKDTQENAFWVINKHTEEMYLVSNEEYEEIFRAIFNE